MDKFTKAYEEIQKLRDIFLENGDNIDYFDKGYSYALRNVIDILVKIQDEDLD